MSESNRTASYASREKEILAGLVEQLLESEEMKNATLADKNHSWKCVKELFNYQPEICIPRTTQQLRKMWKNMKQRRRKEAKALGHNMLASVESIEVIKPDAEAAANSDFTVACPWDSNNLHTFERAETSRASSESGDAAESQDIANSAESLTNKANDLQARMNEILVILSTKYHTKKPATPSGTESVVPEESKNSLLDSSGTSPTKNGVANESRRMFSEEELRSTQFQDTIYQQQEVHHFKIKIAKEELLRVENERKRAAKGAEETTVFHVQRATDEAQLASLKLNQFQKEILSEDPDIKLQNSKKQIVQEELLLAKENRKRAAQRSELLHQAAEKDLQRAVFEHQRTVLDHQRVAHEAELASLKLKQFNAEIFSDDPDIEFLNLKKQISEEELLRAKEQKRVAVRRAELLHQTAEQDFQRAILDHRRAAHEAELASLKLKRFKGEMLFEDPNV